MDVNTTHAAAEFLATTTEELVVSKKRKSEEDDGVVDKAADKATETKEEDTDMKESEKETHEKLFDDDEISFITKRPKKNSIHQIRRREKGKEKAREINRAHLKYQTS